MCLVRPTSDATLGRAAACFRRDPVLQLAALFFAVLVVAALSMDVVKTTYGVKGDEATYVSMALSVAHDGDLSYTREDIARFFRLYGGGPEGIFLKPGQGAALASDRLYFGKSYIYPIVAAPFAWMAGLNGLLVFNLLLFTGVFLCLYTFASTRLSPGGATLTSTAFLGASVAPLHGVFLTPETFNLALACFAYFFWLYKEVAPQADRLPLLLQGRRAELIAAVLLGLAAFSKPSNLPLVAPLVALAWCRRRFLNGALLGVTCCAVMVSCFAINTWITGEWNYQGGLARKTFYNRFPFEQPTYSFDRLGISVVTNDLEQPASGDVLEQFGLNVGYFVAGRHFGLVPYFFPGLVIVAWMVWQRRKVALWQVLTAGMLVLSAAGFLVVFPHHWAGGGGPLGNRYFISFYPAFFFLLPCSRSVVPGLIAWAGGALFLAHALVNPFLIAKNPWILHQQGALRMLPIELTAVNDLPIRLSRTRSRIGYNTDPRLRLHFLDENAELSDDQGIWILGGKRADLIVRAGQSLDSLTVQLSSPVSNHVAIAVDGISKSIYVSQYSPATLTYPVRGVQAIGGQNFVISVTNREGMVPRLWIPNSHDTRSLGVRLRLTPHAAGGD